MNVDIKEILNALRAVINSLDTVSEKIESAADRVASLNKDTEQLPKVVTEKVEFLTLTQVKQLINAYKPEAGNGVVSTLTKSKDSVEMIMAFVNGRNLLDNSDNVLIVVSAEAVSKEIKNLFGDSKAIILK